MTVVFHKAKPRYDIQIPENPFDLLGQEFEPVGYTWSGDIVGNHGGYAIMVTHGAKCVASVHVTDVGLFHVRPIPGSLHAVRELDASLPFECGTDSQVSSAGEGAAAGGGCEDEDAAGCEDGSVIDIMVVYTPSAKAAIGGETAIEMVVDVAIEEVNGAYNRSAVDTMMRLVYTGEIAYPNDPPGYPLDNLRLQWDGWLDDVHPLRNSLRADLVSLLVRDGVQGPSVALLPDTQSPFHESRAFSAVRDAQAVSSFHHFAHETGHNLGCAHHRLVHCPCDEPGVPCTQCPDNCIDNCDCQDGVCVFSYGHKFGPNPQTYRTIMATRPGSMELYYSNPAVLGPLGDPMYPTGVAFPSCDSADNAQTMNIMRDTVANYRQSCDTTDTTNIASNDYYTGQANADSSSVSISHNGQYMGFASDAGTFGGQDLVKDIFLYNRESGLVSLVSRHFESGDTGDSYSPAVSGNGRFVAFTSDADDIAATGLASHDNNNLTDVYVWEQPPPNDGRLSRLSVDSNENETTTGASFSPSITFDGRFVAFHSAATDLVTSDNNGTIDIFVRDRNGDLDVIYDEPADSLTYRVSLTTLGTEANGHCVSASISANTGQFIAFESDADNLLLGGADTNGVRDVYVRDTAVPASTFRVSVSTAGVEGDGTSSAASISGDGQFVAFESVATTLIGACNPGVSGDCNGFKDIFLRDTLAQPVPVTFRVSDPAGPEEANGASFAPAITADGRFVAFSSYATNLLTGLVDTNGQPDVFVYEISSGTITRASINSSSEQATGGASAAPSISSNGRFVAFESDATNLVLDDQGGFRDVFFRDRGSSCVGDFDGDSVVDGWDLAALLGAWGSVTPCTPYVVPDLDQDCTVGPVDLAILLANWGLCP